MVTVIGQGNRDEINPVSIFSLRDNYRRLRELSTPNTSGLHHDDGDGYIARISHGSSVQSEILVLADAFYQLAISTQSYRAKLF